MSKFEQIKAACERVIKGNSLADKNKCIELLLAELNKTAPKVCSCCGKEVPKFQTKYFESNGNKCYSCYKAGPAIAKTSGCSGQCDFCGKENCEDRDYSTEAAMIEEELAVPQGRRRRA